VASVGDRKRERLLLVLLMTRVYEATHAAFDLWKKSVTVAFNICKRVTHSGNLLATAMTFGVRKSNLKVAGEVVVVGRREPIKEFF
jgi:hypothetical protein